jgi:hypothetical protein
VDLRSRQQREIAALRLMSSALKGLLAKRHRPDDSV